MSTFFEPEYCDSCHTELEVGQIGLCEDCQDALDEDEDGE